MKWPIFGDRLLLPGDLCNSPVLECGSPERVYATFLIPVNHFKSTNWLTDNRSPTTKRFNAIAEQLPVYPRSQGSCHPLCILMWLSYKQQLMWLMSQFLYSMWGEKSLLRCHYGSSFLILLPTYCLLMTWVVRSSTSSCNKARSATCQAKM